MRRIKVRITILLLVYYWIIEKKKKNHIIKIYKQKHLRENKYRIDEKEKKMLGSIDLGLNV